MAFEKPILFIIFNREDTSRKVFDEIKKIQPAKLYIAADGPRKYKNEDEKCLNTRNIIKIDWDCEVKTLYRNENLGCKKAVSEAITWFFENEDDGIILEDDCLPNQSFFYFCESMLNLYKNDNTVMHIGGCNFQQNQPLTNYYFSKYVHVWGWASWKRAWQNYNSDLNNSQIESIKNLLNDKNRFSNDENKYWQKTLKNLIENNIDTWDYQWVFHIWQNNGLAITPPCNLISNIGFNQDATHTVAADDSANLATLEINNFNFEKNDIKNNVIFDTFSFKYCFKKSIYKRIINKLTYLTHIKF